MSEVKHRCHVCGRVEAEHESKNHGWELRQVLGEYYGRDSSGNDLWVQSIKEICPDCIASGRTTTRTLTKRIEEGNDAQQ